MDKTNVMRILDKYGIKYQVHIYDNNETNGELVAKLLGEDEMRVFKTIVTVSNTNEHFVFMIPVSSVLNLKKAAKVAKVKSIEMIKQKELLPLTGYIHGGCSPIGMKKEFPTFIDEVALLFDTIYFSAGKVGMQIECSYDDLKKVIDIDVSDITN